MTNSDETTDRRSYTECAVDSLTTPQKANLANKLAYVEASGERPSYRRSTSAIYLPFIAMSAFSVEFNYKLTNFGQRFLDGWAEKNSTLRKFRKIVATLKTAGFKPESCRKLGRARRADHVDFYRYAEDGTLTEVTVYLDGSILITLHDGRWCGQVEENDPRIAPTARK